MVELVGISWGDTIFTVLTFIGLAAVVVVFVLLIAALLRYLRTSKQN